MITREEVREIVSEALERAFAKVEYVKAFGSRAPGVPVHFVLGGISDAPIDGTWYVIVDPVAEPIHRHQYFELLTEVEEELEGHDIMVLLSPAINDRFEYEVDGHVIEVEKKSWGLFASPKNQPPRQPHYHALFNDQGEMLSSGAVRGGYEAVEPPAADLLERLSKAVQMHLARFATIQREFRPVE